jgi:hypothetical protein
LPNIGAQNFSTSLYPVQRDRIVQWRQWNELRNFRFSVRIDDAGFDQPLAAVHDTMNDHTGSVQAFVVEKVRQHFSRACIVLAV